jgi:hypothetical protein
LSMPQTSLDCQTEELDGLPRLVELPARDQTATQSKSWRPAYAKWVHGHIADRFQQSTDPVETEKLREELARMTFGGWCRRYNRPSFRRRFGAISSIALKNARSRKRIVCPGGVEAL